jgi:hypothetical protein
MCEIQATFIRRKYFEYRLKIFCFWCNKSDSLSCLSSLHPPFFLYPSTERVDGCWSYKNALHQNHVALLNHYVNTSDPLYFIFLITSLERYLYNINFHSKNLRFNKYNNVIRIYPFSTLCLNQPPRRLLTRALIRGLQRE